MVILGFASIIAGGLVAAATGPLELSRGSWVAAYLVLVGGIAQLALGWVPGWLARPLPERHAWWQLAAWNLGNAIVIVATLAEWPLAVVVGSVLLVIALGLALFAWFGQGAARAPVDDAWSQWAAGAYLALIVLLIVSIPVGIMLAIVR